MSNSKKHHYISQFYLRGFANPVKTKNRGLDHLLGVLNIKNGKKREDLVGNVAFQNYFNRIENFQFHENELEDALIDVEGQISQSVYKLRESDVLTDQIKDNLCLLMALFSSRTPHAREKLKSENISIQDELYHALTTFPHLSEGRDDGVTFKMLRYAKETGQMEAKVPSQDTLIHTELTLVKDLAHDLSQRVWSVLRPSDKQGKFITSDCPVVIINPNSDIEPMPYSHTAVRDPKADVFFPVTQDLAIYGVIENTAIPNMAGSFFSALNTYVVNNGGRHLFYNPIGFSVMNENMEICGLDDVLAYVREYNNVEKPNPSSGPKSSAGDWKILDLKDVIEVIKKSHNHR